MLCTPCVLLRGSGVLNFILLFLVVAGAARERFVMFDPPETREPRDVCVTRVWPCAACVRIRQSPPVVCGRTKPKGNKKDAHFFGFQLISYILVQFIHDTFIYTQFSFFSHDGLLSSCRFFTAAVWCVPLLCRCRWFILSHNKPISQKCSQRIRNDHSHTHTPGDLAAAVAVAELFHDVQLALRGLL